MSVTISSSVYWADWPNASDATFEVRAKSNRSWVSAESEIVGAGESRVVGTGTITALRPTLPAITLPSTSAGLDDQTSKWTVTLHRVGKTQPVTTVLADFPLPVSFEPSVTWAQIKIHKNGKQPLRDTSVYTKTETDYQISLAAGNLNRANVGLLGRIETATTPADPLHPKAVLTEDPRVLDISNYASFAAMISAIGSTQYTFNIHGNINVTANATVPANITLRFLQGGRLTLTTGVTLIIRGPVIADPIKIFYNALASQGTVSFSGNKSVDEFYSEWWGAVKDGSTDDTAAIQAAIQAADTRDGGTVRLLTGTYQFTNLVLTQGSNQHFVHLVGDHVYRTILRTNITSGTALTLYHSFGLRLANFTIINQGARGTSYGVACDGPGSSGTQVANGIVEHVMIDGFSIDWSTSSPTDATTSSEFSYVNLDLRNADVGFANANFNGLNHNFINLLISTCEVGLHSATAGCYIRGGTASNNDIDFKFQSSGTYDIEDFRSETWGTHFLLMSGDPSVNLRNVLVEEHLPVDANAIAIKVTSGSTFLDSCTIKGRIHVEGGSIHIRGGYIEDTVTNTPFYSDFGNQGTVYSFQSVFVPSGRYPDGSGIAPAGFPLNQFSGDGDFVTFKSEYDTTFPARVKHVQTHNRKSYLEQRTLGATVGNTTLIGTIGAAPATDSRLISSVQTKELLLRVGGVGTNRAVRVYALALNAIDLGFAPLTGTWQEVAMLYGAPSYDGSYAVDALITGADSITLRLRRVTTASEVQTMFCALETFQNLDTFTPASTTGTGGTVSGIIAIRKTSPIITFTANDATPSVRHGNHFKTANSGATSITTFDEGDDGQVITVIVNDANTTFVNGATLVTRSGSNISASSGLTYSFIYDSATPAWRQVN